MIENEENDGGDTSTWVLYAGVAAVLGFLWLKRDAIMDYIKDLVASRSAGDVTDNDVVNQAKIDQLYFDTLIRNSNTDILDKIIESKTPDEWLSADNPYLPGYSMTIIPWVKK